MEATVVSMGKAVLEGALGYARSKAAEEVALQLGVEGDVVFIADELEMMQSFLMTADEEGEKNKVLNTWVKQVRDVTYNVEDSLMDFALYSEKKPSWWRSPRTMGERRRIAKEVKTLRGKVEDVSNRNLRYRLIKDSSISKPAAAEEQARIASAAMFGINEARLVAVEQEESKVDLLQLITSEEEDLRMIAVWGTTSDLGKTSAIQEVYDDPNILTMFGFRAWIRLMHPFDPNEFLRNLVWQFYENSLDELGQGEEGTSVGANVLMKMDKMDQKDLVHVFNAQVSSNSYLIVIDDLSTIVEWHCIKKFFSNNKKRSRIIVSTQQAEIARLCTEKPYQVSKLKQLSSDQTLYLFYKKVISASGSAEPIYDSNKVTTLVNNTTMSSTDIQEEDQQPKDSDTGKVSNSTDGNKFHRSRTMALVDEVLTGRQTEKSKVIELIGQPEDEHGCKVISVWGMGGIGKTTLVTSAYRSQQLSCWKRAWATALRPFNPEVLLRSIALQLLNDDTATGTQKKSIATMKFEELERELSLLLNTQKCFIVLDDISSTSEWQLIKSCLGNARRIVITTREKNIAKYCSREDKNMYSLSGLKDDIALDLLKKKVFKKKIDLGSDMMEQVRLILKKCDGLPLAISVIGGFLATKPATAIEWRKMNDHISAELQINPELRTIKTILMRSYDGLPYHLKSCFLYLSIFPEDYIIRRDRLVRRWIAEGYSRDMHGMTAEEVGRMYFDDLLDRSMILPREGVNHRNGTINSCQLHDIIREICISKAREENLVFTLEEGCCLSSTQGPIRHLVISSNWIRDKDVFESMLDLSHVRSLTVFGEWRPFFISGNMRFLRVLDLEDTIGLRDHHLDHIGQLHHLKYLSVRGCHNIYCLPHSLGNLRHLQTLDARGTPIFELPTTITNLRKLQHLCTTEYIGTTKREDYIIVDYLKFIEKFNRSLCGNKIRHVTSCFLLLPLCPLLWRPQLLPVGLNRHDIFNLYRFCMACFEDVDSLYVYSQMKVSLLGVDLLGVDALRGIGKLKALHTLDLVNIARGKGSVALKELRELTQLRKLRVVGISDKNSKDFWSAIAGHNQLRSLYVYCTFNLGYGLRIGSPDLDTLDGCLGADLSPPKFLEKLQLRGKLVKATEWIHQLQNLSKLLLAFAQLEQDAIHALGMLPNLAVLRPLTDSFVGRQLHFQGSSFPSLMVLELSALPSMKSLLFEEHTMPKLEVLQVVFCNLKEISGLPVLASLKKCEMSVSISDELKKWLQSQVDEHLNHVSLDI